MVATIRDHPSPIVITWNEPMRTRIFLTLTLAALATFACSGCGDGASASVAADPDAARQVLMAALDAWKSGATHDAPARATPPVRVADEDWLAGATLIEYAPADAAQALLVGNTRRWPVVLTIRDARGRAVKRSVEYLVTTGPRAMVIRQD
jgi:hypothetical protein